MDKDNRPVNIEDLNKTQLVLLVILLSFVTSIATGIIAAALVERTSPQTTQTINRVVQRTIEKAVPSYVPGKTQTIIVKEDDLVVDAVTKTRSGTATLQTRTGEAVSTAYSIGGGTFIAPAGGLLKDIEYQISIGENGYHAKLIATSEYLGIAVLVAMTSDGAEKKIAIPALSKDADTRAGQTAVFVGPTLVEKSIVQATVIKTIKSEDDTVLASWSAVDTTSQLSGIPSATPVVDLDASILGFVFTTMKGKEIISIDSVMKFVDTVQKSALAR